MDKLRTLFGISRPLSPIPPERRESNVAASDLAFPTSPGVDSGSSNIIMANPGPKCFRIANVPSNWTKNGLLNSLKEIDPSLINSRYQLSLFPACHSSSQTALLNLHSCTEYFEGLKSNDFNYVSIPDGDDMVYLVIDSHFYDMTPLNSPGEEIIADVVAVTGLAGHAFDSWKSHETHQMWLKDFLPKDVQNIRVMIYGYDSSLARPTTNDTRLIDYRRNFVQQLQNARGSAENRPIIFMGHSLGGILILQTLVESNRNPHYESILGSTKGIFLFGTPHQGLKIDDFDVKSGEQRTNLIMQLRDDSEFLEVQKEDMIRIWEGLKEIKLASFYETKHTLDSNNSGEVRQMVERFSALTFLQSEHRIPVDKSHKEIVKFATPTDPTYQTVVKHLKECVGVCYRLQTLEKLPVVNAQKHAERESDQLKERLARLRN